MKYLFFCACAKEKIANLDFLLLIDGLEFRQAKKLLLRFLASKPNKNGDGKKRRIKKESKKRMTKRRTTKQGVMEYSEFHGFRSQVARRLFSSQL